MIPETNHDVDISIYHDFLEDQGIIVDREEEESEQFVIELNVKRVGTCHRFIKERIGVVDSSVHVTTHGHDRIGGGYEYVGGMCVKNVGGLVMGIYNGMKVGG